MTTKNARFWIFYNDTFIKITLRPQQVLHFGYSRPTEEGWTSYHERLEHCGDAIRCDYHQDGADCDGRHSYSGGAECFLSDLRARETPDHGAVYEMPDWIKTDSSQRDYAAEAAGY